MQYYKLVPANYLTSPGLAWDALLLQTKVELELTNDVDMLSMIEKQKRGGLCYVGSKRHVKANNKYIADSMPEEESNYLVYWDANNLYGWAINENLQCVTRMWDNTATLRQHLNTPDDSLKGYIVEVDLEFPQHLHDKFKEFPPCP